MPTQLSFAEAPRRGPVIAVLPDAARVEERLARLARQRGFVAGKVACTLAELERALIAARKALQAARLTDPHRALWLAVEHLERGGRLPASIAAAAELELDSVLDWTPLRLRLASALAGRVRVRIRLPWSDGRPELTEALEPTLRAVEKLADPAPELELFDPAEASPALAAFLGRLFATDGPAAAAPVELVSCASPAAQAREVARRCAALLRSGVAPDAIAVAARTLAGGTAEELGAALDRAGLPWRERRGRPAWPAAPVQLALALLDLVERDFPRERLIDLLCSRLVWMAEDGDRLPPQALARILREAHARDDATGGGYAAALAALAQRLARRQKDSAHVDEVLRRVQRAMGALRRLPAHGTLAEHGAALLEVLGRWGLWRRLRAPEPDDAGPALERAAAAALARDQVAARALEQACAGLARAAGPQGEPRVSRAEFAQLLSEALAGASLPPGGARGGAVQLLELRELAGRAFEHVFVVGLVDGELPALPSVDLLLTEDERRAVNQAASRPVFRVAPPRQAEEPLLFQLALCAARRSATLLWPFADEAARALGVQPLALPLAPVPLASDCADTGSLLARAALDAFAEPAWRVTPPAEASAAKSLASALAASTAGSRFRRIARAAAAERERVRVFVGEIPPGRFSGQLSGPALQAARAAFAFGPEAPVSAGQLEDHATCAFRTLGKRLLHIDVDDRDDAELGSRERGKLLHRCLERFFRRMGDEGRLPLRGVPEEIALLREVAAGEMDAFAQEEHVGHRALWELKRAELVEILVAVIESDRDARPLELERRFGFDGPDSWPALRIGDVHVRGIVDRIDRLPDGSLLVLDYKSGRKDSLAPKLKPEALLAPEFQLALYVEMLRRREPGARVDAAYFSLRDAQRTRSLRASGIDLEALPVAQAVEERVARMRAGRFEARPLSCDHCPLEPACRLVALPTDPEENGGEVPRA